MAVKNGVPLEIARKLVGQESGGSQDATSKVGAHGVMQLMPGTAKMLGVDINDPLQNIEGGFRYLAKQYATFGSWPLALAAYNAGPAAVMGYENGRKVRGVGIPPYAETINYVKSILGGR